MNIVETLIKDKWILLFAVIIVARFVGYSPVPQSLYFVAIIVATIYVINTKRFKINKYIILYLVAALLSIGVNLPPEIFSPFERLTIYIFMLIAVSPLLENNETLVFRHKLLKYCFLLINILTILSFFCFFLGINLMQLKEGAIYEEDFSIGGTFAGLTSHSMVLGPLAALSLIYFIHNNRIRPHFRILFLIMSAASLLFSASRGAIIAAVIATLFSLFTLVRMKVLKLKYVIIGILITASTFTYWSFAIDGIIYKQTIRSDGTSNTRSGSFENRINEFTDNPILGVGFASIDLEKNPSEFRAATKTVEYGSSWLAILSTTGILGFIPFVILFYKKTIISINNNLLIAACLIMFSIHFIVEGYIFSVGNPLCLMFWLILANANSRLNDKTI